MRLALLLFLIVALMVDLSLTQRKGSGGFCPRQPSLLENKERKCRKACDTNLDCYGRKKRCICDGSCGKSCFNPLANCLNLTSPTNGSFEYVDGRRFWRSTATYKCDEGFALRGVSLRTCQSDRRWSGEAPICSDLGECGQSLNAAGIRQQISILSRVVGGEDAKEGAWPWQAGIFLERFSVFSTFEGGLFGGGSLINKHWILTAAHVIVALERRPDYLDATVIALGYTELPSQDNRASASGKLYRPRFIIKHPQYEKASLFDYDFAVIRIGRETVIHGEVFKDMDENSGGAVTFTDYIRPVCLPCTGTCVTPDDVVGKRGQKLLTGDETPEQACAIEGKWLTGRSDPKTKVDVVVTGFGSTRQRDFIAAANTRLSKKLQQASLSVEDDVECQEAIQNVNRFQQHRFGRLAVDIPFTKQMICARQGNKTATVDACQGDSGGPLIRKVVNANGTRECWVQMGIVSFGFGCAWKQEDYTYPGFYADVSRVLYWINSCRTRLTDAQRSNNLTCEEIVKCRLLPITEGIDAQTDSFPLLLEGFEVSSHTLVKFVCTDSRLSIVGSDVVTCLPNGTWSGPYPTECEQRCHLYDLHDDVLAKTSEGKIPLANANFRIGEVLLFSCERSNRILQGSSRLECLEDGNWSSPVPTECRQRFTYCYGGPHYSTFDGKRYDFQGICSYILVQNNQEETDVPLFLVEVVNENRDGNTQIAWLNKAYIKIDAVTIELSKGRTVKIDGVTVNLPYEHTGLFSIKFSGRFVLVETSFGLEVSYDGYHYLAVGLAARHARNIKGLCGNYNHDPEDDLQLSSSGLTDDVTEFANQYQTETKQGCKRYDRKQDVEILCADEVREHFAQDCSILISEGGCFENCTINSKKYYDDCVSDACAFGDSRVSLENNVGSYAAACQDHGMSICSSWRKDANIPMDCPANSTYSVCASRCPKTCTSAETVICDEACVEGCECDAGLVLSGDKCVPSESCGCQYRGLYYQANERFYEDESCTIFCVCSDGQVTCRDQPCKRGQTCKLEETGRRACFAQGEATCSVIANLFYQSFDGARLPDNSGVCLLVLAKTVNINPTSSRWFSINAAYEHRDGNTRLMYPRSIIINFRRNQSVVLWKNESIFLNGEKIDGYNRVFMKIQSSGRSVRLSTSQGLTVLFDGYDVRITLSSTYVNRVDGMCGNYNGNWTDDFQTLVPEAAVPSQQVGECNADLLSEFSCSSSDLQKWSRPKHCGVLEQSHGAFSKCHDTVDPAPYLSTCIRETCATGNRSTINQTLQSYVRECQLQGISLCNWRQKAGRRNFDCPPNSRYEGCASPCPDTCQLPFNSERCDITGFVEDCVCNVGYVRDGSKCIRRHQCGTEVNGIYRSRGLDECAENLHDCDINAVCNNTEDSFTCTCNQGYRGNGRACADIDECMEDLHNCDVNAQCLNSNGRFTCSCEAGFTGNGQTCSDINECVANIDNCDENAFCLNSVGSYSCTCSVGYTGDGLLCADIDECATNLHNCDENSFCANLVGNHSCTCNMGYTGTGQVCVDVDECEGEHGCNENALCINIDGSYSCVCSVGYSGNGRMCEDIDECLENPDICGSNAICMNNNGSYSCVCAPGLRKVGRICQDVNECLENLHDCDENAFCVNHFGNFNCSCVPGYTGNGRLCITVPYVNAFRILELIRLNENGLRSVYRNWYRYEYDGVNNRSINDGGHDMFDGANIITVTIDNGLPINLVYNQSYSYENIQFGSRAGDPFFGIFWINGFPISSNITIQVTGNAGSDGRGSTRSYIGTINSTNYRLEYNSFQIYGADDPTICEVFFEIYNPVEWQSSQGRPSYTFRSDRSDLDTTISVQAGASHQHNFVIGYTLLSRYPTALITQDEIELVLGRLLNAIARNGSTLVIPVPSTTSTTDLSSSQGGNGDGVIVPRGDFGTTAAQAISARVTNQIQNIIPGWFSYTYDRLEPFNQIGDGGNDMYDDGNQVFLYKDNNPTFLTYNQSYRFGDDDLSSVAGHPFLVLLWVENIDRENLNYTIQVRSDPGADGSGVVFRASQNISEGSFTVQYHVLQVHSAFDPSICEVYFLISNTQEWLSSGSYSYNVVRFSTGSTFLENSVQLVGRPIRVMMGYTLLSKQSGEFISQSEIERVLREYMNALNFEATSVTVLPPTVSIGSVVTSLSIVSSRTSQISNWYNYLYDGDDGRIFDGGNDMYDGGNMIQVYKNGAQAISVVYNRTYEFNDYTFTSVAFHPFIAWLNVTNPAAERVNFTIRVHGNAGADGRGSITRYNGSFVEGNHRGIYYVFQIGDAGDPSICEVYSLFYNGEDWDSVLPEVFEVVRFGTSTDALDNAVQMIGDMQNVIMGYTLLSRSNGQIFEEALIRSVLISQLIALGAENTNLCRINNGGCEEICTNEIGSVRCDCRTDSYLSEDGRTCRGRFEGFSLDPHDISRLSDLIPNWHNYHYFGSNTSIVDGGNDMYDGGNFIKVYRNGLETVSATYNRTYRFNDYQFTTVSINPFTAWLNVSNRIGENVNYTLRVHGNAGADESGNITRFDGSFNVGNYHCRYIVFQVGNAFDPSICEVYALFYNRVEWQSVTPELFTMVRTGSSTDNLDNSVQMVGRMRNVIMAYTLLSRQGGAIVDAESVKRVLSYQIVLLGAEDIDECQTNNGGCQDICTNYIGGFECSCLRENTILSSDGRSCVAPTPPPVSISPPSSRFIADALRDYSWSYFFQNWFNYTYDGNNTYINDGGSDMYDVGNYVEIYKDQLPTILATYDQSYEFEDYAFTSLATYPFFAWLNVTNPSLERHNFTLRVHGWAGADGRGRVSRFNGSLNLGFYHCQYFVFQVWNTPNPTICEVYALFHSPGGWYSVEPDVFNMVRFGSGSDRIDNAAQLVGRMRNVIVGYTLLSRPRGAYIEENLVERVLISEVGLLIAAQPSRLPFLFSVQLSSFEEIALRLNNFLPDYIPNWYSYNYDVPGIGNHIQDGGNDMYDGGNYVKVYRNGSLAIDAEYNRTYEFADYNFKTIASHPFMAWLNVTNPAQAHVNFTIRVHGNAGADGSGNVTRYNGSIQEGNYHCQFFVFQIGNAFDPSICEVYALFYNSEDWESQLPDLFTMVHSRTDTGFPDNSVQIVGRMQNVMLGYTLLSRSRGLVVQEALIRGFLSFQLEYLGAGVDVNECLLDNGGCEDICLNYAGSYQCLCNQENTILSADQRSCEAINTPTSVPARIGRLPLVLGNSSQLARFFSRMAEAVPNFYYYRYDGFNNQSISDGGNDMYDSGNNVKVYKNGVEAVTTFYNRAYQFEDFTFTSAAVHPFIAWLNISNVDQEHVNFTIRVHGNAGADGNGNITRYSGSINQLNYHCQYFVFQISNAGDPSICEVYALFYNTEDWGSIRPDVFNVVRSSNDTNFPDNSVQIVGRMRNVVLAYTLLSRSGGLLVEQETIRRVLTYELLLLGAPPRRGPSDADTK